MRRDPSRVVDSVVRSILGAIRLGCYGGAGALVNERGLALGLLLSVALKDDIWLSFAGLGPGRRVPASGRARVVDSPRVALSVIISLTRSEPPKADSQFLSLPRRYLAVEGLEQRNVLRFLGCASGNEYWIDLLMAN